MSIVLWIIGWAVVLGLVAFFAVREVRSGRKGPAELDRTKHDAVKESTSRSQVQGPNGLGQSFWG
jgi:hypothetical protein